MLLTNDELRHTIIANARTWLGTPWLHNQRVKGVGVDCVNFLYAIAVESGIELEPIPESYARLPLRGEIEQYLDRNFIRTNSTIEPCDVLVFNWSGYNCHVGIATSNKTIIHAHQRINKVVEHGLDGIWIRCLKGVYRHGLFQNQNQRY